MVNGMYSVSFSGPGGLSGSGVCAVKDGAINGGDAGYGYLGNFKVDASKVSATQGGGRGGGIERWGVPLGKPAVARGGRCFRISAARSRGGAGGAGG